MSAIPNDSLHLTGKNAVLASVGFSALAVMCIIMTIQSHRSAHSFELPAAFVCCMVFIAVVWLRHAYQYHRGHLT